MKTTIKTKIATVLTAILFLIAIFPTIICAAKAYPIKIVSLTSFRKISVKGNVEVMLVQRKDIGINYAEDNLGSVKAILDGQTLRITANGSEMSKIFIYVNDLYRIEAEDHAIVKTQGKLKIPYLQVFLRNEAQVEINSETSSLYTSISDHAKLTLSGSTDNHFLVTGKAPRLIFENFAALKTSIKPLEISIMDKEIAFNLSSINIIN
ncbi:hypothetical protein EV200_104498 [Pedobacter psychrotolerans]|uniref:Putative auto-transporter adhesin head GIN domain-containing protein n=1 Tax=Pedobacter psychrotolerans TaxID=1843235 RepID=A0A4R2HGI9_9SPHI|nr:DUF2807 domain-containing protein [Pedobacter psychrotolerans]TCO25460.1 hypothetical protein EV200_104498 [Pedobacter psychrotolerans]GGE45269.1 hypothetical protein GCM10011413_09270 [Pedobacter psychrotolerans]